MDAPPAGNATGPEFCKGEALGRGSLFGWPTPCVLEATSSVLHGVFVLFVFQFALYRTVTKKSPVRHALGMRPAAAIGTRSFYSKTSRSGMHKSAESAHEEKPKT